MNKRQRKKKTTAANKKTQELLSSPECLAMLIATWQAHEAAIK